MGEPMTIDSEIQCEFTVSPSDFVPGEPIPQWAKGPWPKFKLDRAIHLYSIVTDKPKMSFDGREVTVEELIDVARSYYNKKRLQNAN